MSGKPSDLPTASLGRESFSSLPTEGNLEPPRQDDAVRVLSSRIPRGWGHSAKQIVFVALNYTFSISISVFNSYVFSQKHRNLGMPIFAACLFDFVQFSLALLSMYICEGLSWVGVRQAYSKITWRVLYALLIPCAASAGLETALSNSCLRVVDLASYAMIKSCTPVFILFFAFALGLERPSWSLVGIICIIGAGVAMSVWRPGETNGFGIALALSASVMAGARWGLTQLILKRSASSGNEEEELLQHSGPLETILYLTPLASIIQLLLSLVIEGPVALAHSNYLQSFSSAMHAFGFCCIGGVIAFCLVISQYKVVEQTSVLTLSLLGTLKGLLVIGVSVIVFGTRITLMNACGAAITVAGCLLYQSYRLSEVRLADSENFGDADEDQASALSFGKHRHRKSSANFLSVFQPTDALAVALDPFGESEADLDILADLWLKGHLVPQQPKELPRDESQFIRGDREPQCDPVHFEPIPNSLEKR